MFVLRRGVCVAAVLLGLLVASTTVPAAAESTRVADNKGASQQDRWNELRYARFSYTTTSTIVDVKVADLDKRRTRVFANIQYDDGYLRIKTAFRGGRPVARATFNDESGASVTVPVTGTWSASSNRVRFFIDNLLSDPRPNNLRAGFGAFTVQKGAFHGPNCPFKGSTYKQVPCNDDYVTATVNRD